MSNPEQSPAQLSARRNGEVLIAAIAGDWLDRTSLPDISAVEAELTKDGVGALEFDTKRLAGWNSALLVRLLALHDLCVERKIQFRTQTLSPGLAKLIALSQAVPEKKDAARKTEQSPLLERLGNWGVGWWGDTARMLKFIGDNVLAFLKLLRGRAQFRWSDTFLVMQQSGPEALGIVALINFLIGMILAFVGATELARFGASIYTADLVAVAAVREMSCIMTGIIICGRTGAAFAAQLGTMKVNQEIEAFQTFGISPVEFLVLPRMLALILMMPLLCIFADLIAIAGGYLVSTLAVGIAPELYLHRTLKAIHLSAFLLGICKGSFFGVLIALTGCLRGMQCGTNAAAVGQATTSAVVTGITWIIASDGIFAVLCNALDI
ncbi:MAG TPA: ABC transporter permease [Verrucomicrobiae bacterium]|nr:ABC transporter permease [Verrucomicrobiae bacterium]